MHEVHARLLAGATGATDPILALHKGIVFLKVCTEPGSQRTLLIDAPAVLGWPKWRERDAKYGFGLLKQAIGAATRAGLIANHNVDVLAHIFARRPHRVCNGDCAFWRSGDSAGPG